jgi:hypothetical protein
MDKKIILSEHYLSNIIGVILPSLELIKLSSDDQEILGAVDIIESEVKNLSKVINENVIY